MTPSAVRNRVVLITGASRGIGLATARLLLAEGAKIALCARDPARLAAVCEQLAGIGEVWALPADLRDPHAVHGLVEGAARHYGRIDVLVNNAGRAWSGEFARQPPASIDEIIDVNVKGLLHVTQAVLPHLQRARAGLIVNIASGAGRTGFGGLSVYSASKFAVVGFTEALAQEVEAHGIRVYAVCPGAVATDMLEEVTGSRAGMPPDKVARAVLSLAGPRPPVANGECLEVTG
ncbi:MAG: SDR family oxidoreductase [Chromatiales bacterium]|nr:SDR family oxidoreductase [Chromatiales bacterium]